MLVTEEDEKFLHEKVRTVLDEKEISLAEALMCINFTISDDHT